MEVVIGKLSKNFDQEVLFQHYNSLTENENEKKAVVDRILRKIFQQLMIEDDGEERFTAFLDLLVTCVQKEWCNSPTLFTTLSDMFDVITLNQSELIFAHLEQNIHIWKSEAFYGAGKNYLLRTCNDLLKRLSRSQNTIFSGRIQLFLAHLFSIQEKSGLNLMSNFNIENATSSSSQPHHNKEEMVDFKLYRRFWSLQDFFRLPSQCYLKEQWKLFTQSADAVLCCFGSFKLDSSRLSDTCQQQSFFPKYLTNQKLLNLQLNDSNFRRYILLQHLIVFQYLLSSVKFKQAHHVLTEEQTNWIKLTTEKIYELISETPPDGNDFLNVVKHVLSREGNWNRWKNEGCISFIKKNEEDATVNRRKRRSLGDDMRSSSKVVKMGNPELTRLWNLCPDNHEACISSKRNFQKESVDFLEGAISQLDPAEAIEDQYKAVNDPVFSWKAMRMLARSSASFFHATQSKDVKTVPQYLESVLSRLEKELVRNGGTDSPSEEKELVRDGGTDSPSEEKRDSKVETSPSSQGTDDVDGIAMDELVEGVGDGWRRFGEVVGVEGCVLEEIEQRGLSGREACLEVLQGWKTSSEEITAELMEDVLRMMAE